MKLIIKQNSKGYELFKGNEEKPIAKAIWKGGWFKKEFAKSLTKMA